MLWIMNQFKIVTPNQTKICLLQENTKCSLIKAEGAICFLNFINSTTIFMWHLISMCVLAVLKWRIVYCLGDGWTSFHYVPSAECIYSSGSMAHSLYLGSQKLDVLCWVWLLPLLQIVYLSMYSEFWGRGKVTLSHVCIVQVVTCLECDFWLKLLHMLGLVHRYIVLHWPCTRLPVLGCLWWTALWQKLSIHT